MKDNRPVRCSERGCVFPACYTNGETKAYCVQHRREADPHNAMRIFQSVSLTARACDQMAADGVNVSDLTELLKGRFVYRPGGLRLEYARRNSTKPH